MGGNITVKTEGDAGEVTPCPGCERRLVMTVEGVTWLLCLNEHCNVVFYDRSGRILPTDEWPIQY